MTEKLGIQSPARFGYLAIFWVSREVRGIDGFLTPRT